MAGPPLDVPPVVVRDDVPLPPVCALCGAAATTHQDRPFALREPTYRLMLATGVFMGLFIATWMMVKVRPTITHELPAPVAFLGLFLATYAPVWIVASLASHHKGTLRLPVCPAHASGSTAAIQLASRGDGKLAVTGLSAELAAALPEVSAA